MLNGDLGNAVPMVRMASGGAVCTEISKYFVTSIEYHRYTELFCC